MTLDQIKSRTVRNIISGSPTPCCDLRDAATAQTLSVSEFAEACSYFGGYSRLIEQAKAETSWCTEHDV